MADRLREAVVKVELHGDHEHAFGLLRDRLGERFHWTLGGVVPGHLAADLDHVGVDPRDGALNSSVVVLDDVAVDDVCLIVLQGTEKIQKFSVCFDGTCYNNITF